MKEWIVAFSLVGFGLFITRSGYHSIRDRLHIDGATLIEVAFSRAAGEEPVPKTKLDHFLGSVQHWMAVICGPVMAGLGIVIIAGKLGLLR